MHVQLKVRSFFLASEDLRPAANDQFSLQVGRPRFFAMPPKGKAAPRSKRYAGMLESIKLQREGAKKLLKELRSSKKNEDRRHTRLMKSARKLDAKDLMEMAALKQLSEAQMMLFADEMGVKRTRHSAVNAEAERPGQPSAPSGQVVMALENRDPFEEDEGVVAPLVQQADELETQP